MTENESRALGRLEGKVDLLIGMHADTHTRLSSIESWQDEVKAKYAFGKGALAAGAFIVSSIGGFVAWAFSHLMGQAT